MHNMHIISAAADAINFKQLYQWLTTGITFRAVTGQNFW